ncbi:MAG: EAL domain-containing protein [Firmicutes bacterium]|nr:EAL domain-containing protein [Bacillota bacterium]
MSKDKLRILIVDDDEDDFYIIRDLLSDIKEVKYDTVWASSYKAALQALETNKFDACLLDYRLGEHTGLELLQEIVSRGNRTPVILLTGQGDHAIDIEAMNTGASDYLVKGEVGPVILERSIRYAIERKRMEDELFNEKERALVTLASIGDAVITTDINYGINYMNSAAETITAWKNEEAYGRPLSEILTVINEITREPFGNPVEIVLSQNKTINFPNQALLVNRDGREYAIEATASPILNRDNEIGGIVIVLRDVTQTRELPKKISYQASHDSLTGLVNRGKFEEHLEQVLESAKNQGLAHVLFFMDLDRFKIVNDTCGHFAGDQLLKQVANLFKKYVRNSDIVARLGGDEFAVILENCPLSKAMEIAGNIRRAVQEYRFTWRENQFMIGISIGVVEINAGSVSADMVLNEADEACYCAKENGGNKVHVYRGEGGFTKHHGEAQWALDIHRAFEDNRFCLFYQPIVPVRGEKIINQYEILIRMYDENGKIIYPGSFLPAANRYKLMSSIDRWVINTYFAYYDANYNRKGSKTRKRGALCNINLSGLFLNDDEFALDFIVEQLKRYNVPPEAICFEITETLAVANFGKIIKFIQKLKSIGCRFALDDFGNGLATFNYLKNLPVDFVKIDGSFVRHITDNQIDLAMVESINHIAHLMNIKTVAEFVENEAAFLKLKEIGVDYAQGYWIAKPVILQGAQCETGKISIRTR